jgi:hypothetical protein
MMTKWIMINSRIWHNGPVYSTLDFRPSLQDVIDILSINPNAQIAFDGDPLQIYLDGKLHSEGPIFYSDRLHWMNDCDYEIWKNILSFHPNSWSIMDAIKSILDREGSDAYNIKRYGRVLYEKFQRWDVICQVSQGQWQIKLSSPDIAFLPLRSSKTQSSPSQST